MKMLMTNVTRNVIYLKEKSRVKNQKRIVKAVNVKRIVLRMLIKKSEKIKKEKKPILVH